MQKIKVLIVDDNAIFLRAATITLRALPGVRVVGVAASGPEAIPMAIIEQPDLVLLDVNMSGMDGVRTAERMRAQEVTARLVFVSLDEPPHALMQERGMVADGFIAKAKFGDEVQRVIEELFPSRDSCTCGEAS